MSTAKIKSRNTILTPISYPPDDDDENNSSSRLRKQSHHDTIVISPYTNQPIQQHHLPNNNNNNKHPYQQQNFRHTTNNKWDSRTECIWRTLMCLSVTGLIICIGVLVYELLLKNKPAGQYIDDALRNFDFSSGQDDASSLAADKLFNRDPLSVSGFERAEIAKKTVNDIKKTQRRLEESKIQLANVYEEKVWRDHTFFVSIAAFRDVECMMTVRNIFESAKNPRRIFLGIIEQNEHGDPTCIPDPMVSDCLDHELSPSSASRNPFYFCPLDNIRRRRVVASKGRGPCFGRYVSMLMYRDESYYMMIDSHNQFKPGWDADITKMLFIAESPKPVLSHYPLAWRKKKDENFEMARQTTVMCRAHFVSFGYVRMGGLNFVNSRRPRRQPFTAAGFLAADAAVIHEVPFDRHLDFLFDGEELMYSVRLYTHGWDSFSPAWNVVFHDYDRHKAPRFWNIQGNEWGKHQQRSVRRVQWMLKIPKKGNINDLYVPDKEATDDIKIESDKYGLGTKRSLEKFWKYSRVDLVNKIDNDGICGAYLRK